MKQRFQSCVLILFFLFLLAFTKAPARLITTKTGDDAKRYEITNGGSAVEAEDDDSMSLMGSEVCETGDEECLKRRITAEAHLDYIYTQHHNP
ncbi:hypothetical protein Ancab_011213 [Ancistrocladus abbreviatus]